MGGEALLVRLCYCTTRILCCCLLFTIEYSCRRFYILSLESRQKKSPVLPSLHLHRSMRSAVTGLQVADTCLDYEESTTTTFLEYGETNGDGIVSFQHVCNTTEPGLLTTVWYSADDCDETTLLLEFAEDDCTATCTADGEFRLVCRPILISCFVPLCGVPTAKARLVCDFIACQGTPIIRLPVVFPVKSLPSYLRWIPLENPPLCPRFGKISREARWHDNAEPVEGSRNENSSERKGVHHRPKKVMPVMLGK